MKISKIEAVVDAIAALNKYHQPDSLSYQLRSPLLIKSFAKPGKHEVTDEGLRIFDSGVGGYKAAVFDMGVKIKGESNAGLKSTDRLRNLLGVYGIKQEADILAVVYFLRKALKDKDIDALTPISYFDKK